MSDQYGHYPLRSRHRNLVVARVTFPGTNGASPAVASIVDQSGVLAVGTTLGDKVERTAEGTYVLKLRDNYQGVHAQVSALSATDDDSAVVEAISTTAGANTVTVRGQAGALADDLDTVTFSVLLHLSLSDDF